MGLQATYIGFLQRIPGITEPLERMSFKSKLKWTGIILLLFFMMGQITVYGVAPASFEQFRFLEIILGSSFGSLMSLGIGPIVTASIILQLLVGSKIIPWNLGTEEGKAMFQGTQKLLAMLFAFLEAVIYVVMGAVPAAAPSLAWIVILQLAFGGIVIIFMDEVISKWGFGSGISLFIVAGVSKTIIVRMFNPLVQSCTGDLIRQSGIIACFPSAGNPPAGLIPLAMTIIGAGEPISAMLVLLPIVATVIVFILVVYANAIKVEIPLAFGSVRGFGRRWPLKYFYTSNIPVILIAALLANIQLFGRMMSNQGLTWIAEFNSSGNIIGGLMLFLIPPRTQAVTIVCITIGLFALIGAIVAYLTKKDAKKVVAGFSVAGIIVWFLTLSSMGLTSLLAISAMDITRMLVYLLIMMGGAVLFSVFWVSTAGMDAKAVAGQIQSTGMQIPGYRRDPRIMERVLNRYIPVLAVIGGASVGFLAAFADFTDAIGTGTGILLATMIIYNLYEELATRHLEDMHPALRKLMAK
jgi:preprotein translocase subunit SecY